MSGNYLDKLKTLDDKAVKAMLATLKMQINILGTEVTIEKYDEDSEHRKAFGKLFNTDDLQKAPRETKTARLIINRNSLMDELSKQGFMIEVYHWDKILDSGSVVSFRHKDIRYSFKVVKTYTYGLAPHILYKHELMGMAEDADVIQYPKNQF